MSFRDTLSRLNVQSQDWASTWTLFILAGQKFRDTSVRFGISITGTVVTRRFTAARMNLRALNRTLTHTRFRISLNKLRDSTFRFNLIRGRDAVARYLLNALGNKDVSVRFQLAGIFRATSARFNLTASFRNTASRFKVKATTFKDTACRLVLIAFNYEQFANNASTFLTQAIGSTSSANTVVVSNSANFPQRGIFRVLIGTEIMIVYEVHGGTWYVGRGAENTPVSFHGVGTNVYQIITAGGLENLYSEPLIDTVTGQFMYDSATGDILVGKPY